MRNVLKAATIESKFPLLAVERDCIISKDADITVAFRVELPELFTVTTPEYETIHSTWAKAIKVLPNLSLIHISEPTRLDGSEMCIRDRVYQGELPAENG
mgnify:CR=1 FL=1